MLRTHNGLTSGTKRQRGTGFEGACICLTTPLTSQPGIRKSIVDIVLGTRSPLRNVLDEPSTCAAGELNTLKRLGRAPVGGRRQTQRGASNRASKKKAKDTHPERWRAQKRAERRTRILRHPEVRKEERRRWGERYPEKVRAYKRAWYARRRELGRTVQLFSERAYLRKLVPDYLPPDIRKT